MAAFVLLAMLANPTLRAQQDSAYLRLVPAIIQVAREAAENSRPRAAQQGHTLVLDLRSFSLHFSIATDTTVGTEAVAGVVGQVFRDADQSQAIQCSAPGCSVVDDGVFVRLHALARTATGFQALVSCMWTERRPSGRSAIGELQLRVWLEKRGDAWITRRTQVTKQT